MNVRKFLPSVCLAIALVFSTSAFAQKNEIALTAGGYFPVGTPVDILPAVVIEGSFAHRLVGVPLVGVYAEIPVAKTLDIGIGSSHGNFSALFVAPGLKLKLAPSFPVSPWFAVGGGVAHFSANAALSGTSVGRSDTSGVVDIGGGLDMKVAPFVSLRGEARDYFSGSLSFILPTLTGRQHNLIASAGIVLRF